MTKRMKAAIVHEFGKPLVIEEVALPTAGPGQILVKVAATGVCHTDLHAGRRRLAVQAQAAVHPGP